MPHVIGKLWPGKAEVQKQEFADRITREVMDVLHCGDASVSVTSEEIPADDWAEKVYRTDLLNVGKNLYQKLGYTT